MNTVACRSSKARDMNRTHIRALRKDERCRSTPAKLPVGRDGTKFGAAGFEPLRGNMVIWRGKVCKAQLCERRGAYTAWLRKRFQALMTTLCNLRYVFLYSDSKIQINVTEYAVGNNATTMWSEWSSRSGMKETRDRQGEWESITLIPCRLVGGTHSRGGVE